MPVPALYATLHQLAVTFAEGALKTLLNAPLEDILAAQAHVNGKRGPGPQRLVPQAVGTPERGRLKKRSPEEIKCGRKIAAHVRSHPGSKAEQIRADLGIPKREWVFPLTYALKSKLLRKEGTGEQPCTSRSRPIMGGRLLLGGSSRCARHVLARPGGEVEYPSNANAPERPLYPRLAGTSR
jgi:hypothetical protein